jgi:hypothetical protein
VARRCTKGIVPSFPSHPILLAEEAVNAQMFEWEYATEFKQIFETGCQEHIGVKIEAAETIDRKIPEKIVTLNSCGERVEHGPVLRKLDVNELFDLGVIEKQVVEIGIEQAQFKPLPFTRAAGLRLVRLDNPPESFRRNPALLARLSTASSTPFNIETTHQIDFSVAACSSSSSRPCGP